MGPVFEDILLCLETCLIIWHIWYAFFKKVEDGEVMGNKSEEKTWKEKEEKTREGTMITHEAGRYGSRHL